MKASFTIHSQLPGLNDIIGATNHHRYAGATLKKKYTKLVAGYIMYHRVPKFTNPVRITFDWYEPNLRRDPDNIQGAMKFILDALSGRDPELGTGRIPDDSRKWVKSLINNFPAPDKENPRVEVTVEEVVV